MTKMISKEQAKSLVVIYGAWCELEDGDRLGQSVWGKLLLEAQDKTGVYLVNVDLLQTFLIRAEREVA